MTAIVGLIHNGRVLLGCDSSGSNGWTVCTRADTKAFTSGRYVMGFTDSFRMGQILRWSFDPPQPPGNGQLERFMCTTWTDALRQALKDGGWAKKEAEQEVGGCFLVGVSGRLFRVDSDYQVGEVVGGYDAIGSGEQPALGALAATAGLKWGPKRRMRAALEAAEQHIVSVRGPFHYVWETPWPTQ